MRCSIDVLLFFHYHQIRVCSPSFLALTFHVTCFTLDEYPAGQLIEKQAQHPRNSVHSFRIARAIVINRTKDRNDVRRHVSEFSLEHGKQDFAIPLL